MKTTLLATVAVLALLGTQAQAGDNNIYLKAVGGISVYPNQLYSGSYFPTDTGWNGGAAFGYYLTDNIALEADVFHTHTKYTCCDATLDSTSLMGNVVFHMDPSMPVDLYAGLGLGAVNLGYDTLGTASDQNQTVFGGQALAGVGVPVTDNLAVLAEYRYQTSANTTTIGAFGYNSHNFSVGLAFKF